MIIRKAERKDLSRIAEIFVFNNRVNYFPIFQDEGFSFGELQVVPLIENYFQKEEILNSIYVFEDGVIKGFIQMGGTEICKLYVDTCFQGAGIGNALIEFAKKEFGASHLWALEKKHKGNFILQQTWFSTDWSEKTGGRYNRISGGIRNRSKESFFQKTQ